MPYRKRFKSIIGLSGGTQADHCFYPFKIDTYGRGCVHDCIYCYAKAELVWRNQWNTQKPAIANFAEIDHLFFEAFDCNKQDPVSELLRAKYPIRIGGMTDCFTKVDLLNEVTLKLLKLLKEYKYPYIIFTKNALVSQGKYLEALDPALAYVQFSITTPYDDKSAIYEPGASSTSERLEAMRIVASQGIPVAGRICPLFPIYPDGYYSKGLFQNVQPLKYFSWELVDMLAQAGCKTVIAGFLRLNFYYNTRAKIIAQTGLDLAYLFAPEKLSPISALYFSIEEKRYYYERMRDLVHEHGMVFSVCYDDTEGYKEFQYLWDNQEDCCNAPFARPLNLFEHNPETQDKD